MSDFSHIDNLKKWSEIYIKRKWYIAYCHIYINKKSNAKIPIFDGSWKNNFCDLSEINQKIDEFQNNIGKSPNSIAIITGKKSNLFVLDLDKDKEGSLKPAKDFLLSLDYPLDQLNKMWVVQTQSGGIQIYHNYIDHLDAITTTRAKLTDANGNHLPVDCRGEGGLVFCPPSRFLGKDGQYKQYKLLNSNDGSFDLTDPPEKLIQSLLLNNSKNFDVVVSDSRPTREFSELTDKQQDKFLEVIEHSHNAQKGSRSNADFRAIVCGLLYGLPKEVILSYLEKGGKCKELAKRGGNYLLKYFEHSYKNAIKKISENPELSSKANLDSNLSHKITVDEANYDLKFFKFWTLTRNKSTGEIINAEINNALIAEFCKMNGIYYLSTPGNQQAKTVIYKDRLVDDIDLFQLKSLLVEYIRQLSKTVIPYDVGTMIVNRISKSSAFRIFGELPLYSLTKRELLDTPEECYFPYRNFLIKIKTGNEPEIISYRDLPNDIFIYKKNIIDRDCPQVFEYQQSDFEMFINLISTKLRTVKTPEDTANKRKIESIIGYLLHSHKDLSKAYTVVFSDKLLAGESNSIPRGGRGKGTIFKSLSKLRNVTIVNGSVFDRKNRFCYQNVTENQHIFVFDDCGKDFDLQALFSDSTDGLTIERKFQNSVYIPFEKAPKFAISTNWSIPVQGISAERRIVEFELQPYFNQFRNIFDEFGHNFYDGWDQKEWAFFDMYMWRCVRFYLDFGIRKEVDHGVRLKRKQASTNDDFVIWMEEMIQSKDIELDKWYAVSDICDHIKSDMPELNTNRFMLTPHILRKWLTIFCDGNYNILFGKKRTEGRKNPVSSFSITDINKPHMEEEALIKNINESNLDTIEKEMINVDILNESE